MSTMRKLIALLLATVAASAPLLAFAVPYEEGHEALHGDRVQVLGRAADNPAGCAAYLGDPHVELEVTNAAYAQSVHVCGTPDDLRRWAQLMNDAADAVETGS